MEKNIKVTKVMKYTAIMEMLQNSDLSAAIRVGEDTVSFSAMDAVDFIAHEREMTEAKNARKSDKPSKAAIENESLSPIVLEALDAFPSGVQCKVLMKHIGNDAIGSTQKLSSLLNGLMTAGKVSKRTEKGVTLYSKVSE